MKKLFRGRVRLILLLAVLLAAATALTAAGEAEVYGLTRTGGSAAQCCYLDGGTYAYNNALYAYNVSHTSFSANAAQSPITGERLESQRLYGFSKVTGSGTETVYPYPAVVRDRIGRAVHYGTWPVQQHIGTMGVFYWEREQGGNAGYHLSYIGTDNGVYWDKAIMLMVGTKMA